MESQTLGEGFKVGHWTDPGAETGCTVVLPPEGNVTSCDVRGASPGSRELDLLHPDQKLTEVHGILLSGGSAFGLAAATGVVSWLEERGIGYATPVARIPIVPGAVVFDLAAGNPEIRPGPDEGGAACDAAVEEGIEVGRVGAGTGATVGKWAGLEHRVPGGLGLGRAEQDGTTARALAVVNSVGDVVAEDGSVIAGTTATDRTFRGPEGIPMNTVLVVATVEAALGKRAVRWLARRASDGVTVSVRPAHTRYDGDVAFAVAAPPAQASPPDLDLLGYLVTRAVADAVRSAVA